MLEHGAILWIRVTEEQNHARLALADARLGILRDAEIIEQTRARRILDAEPHTSLTTAE